MDLFGNKEHFCKYCKECKSEDEMCSKNQCRECRLEKSRRYYEKNKEKVREKDRRYRENNKEKIREKNRRYRENNKEKIREGKRHYYENNKEAESQRGKIRRAIKKSGDGTPILFIYKRDKGICHLCCERLDLLLDFPDPMSASIDHVVPVSHGGTHEAHNLKLSHLRCNMSKGNRPAGEQLKVPVFTYDQLKKSNG